MCGAYMVLSRREDVSDIWNHGHYTIVEQAFEDLTIRTLCLACPSERCSHVTFTSHLVKILQEEPLTVEGDLECPNCGFRFRIEDGEVWPIM